MKTKRLYITLAILIIALMLVFYQSYNYGIKNASAVELNSGSENLFDMKNFTLENGASYTPNIMISGIDKKGIVFSFTSENPSFQIISGSIYLPAGVYTLSAFLETDYIGVLGIYLISADNMQVFDDTALFLEQDNEKTFTIAMSTFYKIIIYANEYTAFEGSCSVAVNNIMLNQGELALPFVSYGYEATNDDIIAKLEDLFGAESGIIAGASVGTLLILLVIFLWLTKRR